MEYIQAILLGIVQGLTEFLPVSSSGHQVILQHLFGMEELQMTMTISVHLGTILAVFVFFRKEFKALIKGFFSGLRRAARSSLREQWRENQHFRTSIYIIVGTIPAGVAGVTVKDEIEATFSSPLLAGAMLVVTGILLLFTRMAKEASVTRETFSLGKALLVGIAQAVALLPGISRSGSTISMALFLRIDRMWAATFSFLLSAPAVVGAAILEARHVSDLGGTQLLLLGIGCISAAITGYAALAWLIQVVKGGNFHRFGYYCLVVGLLTVCMILF